MKQNAAVTNGHFNMMVHLHTARNTMEYLEKEKIDFIEPDIWPPNSPDLNPVDSGVPFSSEFITDENSRLWKN